MTRGQHDWPMTERGAGEGGIKSGVKEETGKDGRRGEDREEDEIKNVSSKVGGEILRSRGQKERKRRWWEERSCLWTQVLVSW